MPKAAASRPSSLRLRVLSALILVPLAVGAVWFGGPWLAILVAALGAAMGWEWGRLTGVGEFALRETLIVAAIVLPLVAGAFDHLDVALAIGLVGPIAAAAVAPRDRLWTGVGTAWIAAGTLGFLWLAVAPGWDRISLFWLLGVVWATDILAYAAGKGLGGPRLAPRLSPNKTWAGFIGGLVGGALAGFVAAMVQSAPPIPIIAISLGLSLIAQFGDLVESLAKRHFGVKDASGLIPGHGGFLDRLDGLIAASLAAAALTLTIAESPLGIR